MNSTLHILGITGPIYLAIALGLMAALVNLPVRESPIVRASPQTA